VLKFLVRLVRETRALPGVQLGASPRGALHLLAAARAHARLAGRALVEEDDVRAMAPHVLCHRLVLDDGVDPIEIVAEAAANVA
jgi:MoxR-like ATPase